ncbi:protein kinase C delta type-like [Hyla sarda]|uniref:protein kinase C delta type-like n=1 Tax=Hyla sarda TaxID=327740 RepID=UPI0024C3912C|nr:protein kinase C delta type-like [Hyla sarda]
MFCLVYIYYLVDSYLPLRVVTGQTVPANHDNMRNVQWMIPLMLMDERMPVTNYQNELKKKPHLDLKDGRIKRKRPDNGLDGPAQKIRKCGSKADEVQNKEPRPGPSGNYSAGNDPINKWRFTYESYIGKGGFVHVLKVKDKVLNKTLAVKIVEEGSSSSARTRTDIEKEVLQLAAGSPFLIHSYLSFPIEKKWYFFMDFASGGDLHGHLKKKVCLPTAEATFYEAEITSGLQFLHGKGFIHRDIKPENILIDSAGHLRITDFGLALKQTEGVRGYTGTRGYVAPEVKAGKIYNTAADWYSFGVVLFQLTTGRECFKCTISALPKYQLDSSVEAILKELLNEDPKERLGYQGCIRSHPFFFRDIDWAKLEELK